MSERLFAGRYELGERLGSGGMSTVVLAMDRRLERHVAIKLLAEHLAGDREFVARFRREALAGLREIPDAAPLAIVRQLIRQGVEVAELPVLYRTFSGFTDPNWRVRRGLRNLMALF